MQTKKRAKPVKFGKPKATEEPKETKVTLSKETAEADINSDEAKEIKQIIEGKTHPKDDELPEQEETAEDEPKEVKLSEVSSEKKEEDMPLENTEQVTEVEPEELQKKEETGENVEEPEKPSPFGSFTSEPVENKPKKGYFKFFLVVAFVTFLVGIVVIGGISYFSSTMKNSTTSVSLSGNPTPSTEPTASPTPAKPNLSAYTITVLNGSGTTGEAAKAKTMLEGKGFTIGTVGNSNTSDYTKTVVTAKKTVSQTYLTALIAALKETYSVNSVVEDAPSSQTADVVVTIGSDTAK